MRSFLAVGLALSISALQAQSLAFHVHAAPDRATAEHRHGPAIHAHEIDFDEELHVEPQDSKKGGSVITVAVPIATVTAAAVVDAEITQALGTTELQLSGDARAIDVRSHSPPPLLNPFLRGPPSILL